MEKKNPTPVEADETPAFLEKAKANKSKLVWLTIGVVVLMAALLGWYYISEINAAAAAERISLADEQPVDSLAREIYAEVAQSSTPSGERAKAEMGIRLYQDGEYQQAAEYLGDCSLGDNIAAAGVRTLEGDCYVNLENYDKAIRCYNQAISKADGNPMLVPFVLVKLAHVYRAQGNFASEAEAYRRIVDEYPNFNAGQTDIRALYQRALRQSQAQ